MFECLRIYQYHVVCAVLGKINDLSFFLSLHIRKIAKKMMKVVFILVLVPMYDVSEYDVSTYQCTVQY